jgi:hypothetical protein
VYARSCQHAWNSHPFLLQDKELDLKEREEAVRRMHNEAEYSRSEAEANLRSQKEESAALARKTEALAEARSRQARELDEREAAIHDQVCLFLHMHMSVCLGPLLSLFIMQLNDLCPSERQD